MLDVKTQADTMKAGYAQAPSSARLRRSVEPVRVVPMPWDRMEEASQFLSTMLQTESSMYQAFEEMLQGASCFQLPVGTRLGVAGNRFISAGLAVATAIRGMERGEKVCILELGASGESLLTYLLKMPDGVGLSELFQQRTDLEHLMVQAKTYGPLKNLYVLPAGQLPLQWEAHISQCQALIQALQKKFHRVLITVPDLVDQPAILDLLTQLQVNGLMVFNNGQMDRTLVSKLYQRFAHCGVQILQ